ncbi:MAG: hypothetical protein H6816_06930 [Phycisphaerales bacterium]|nr:hypothetical protein [Phycisphaerales bacterium]
MIAASVLIADRYFHIATDWHYYPTALLFLPVAALPTAADLRAGDAAGHASLFYRDVVGR